MQSSTLLPGARIGKYRLVALIATGGMGTVYKATDEASNQTVALKILSPDLASNPVLVERFRREARHAARLKHKNIVTLLESDEVEGIHYLAMEYVEGVDLAEYIRRKGKLDPEESRRILIQAAKAIEHAYSLGITHRDIKPSNFLLANDGGNCRVKMTDLGLSRMQCDEDFRVTQAGCTVGTVDYMAPEQARDSSQADVRSDIYSLGCTLYHMLAGTPPFAEGGLGERIYKHLSVDPVDVRQFSPTVPAGLWTVLRRMLAKHPDDRFQTPADLVEALRSIPAQLGESGDPQKIRVPRSSTANPNRTPSSVALPPTAASLPVPGLTNPPPSPPASPTPRSVPASGASPPREPAPPRPSRRPTTAVDLKTSSDVPDPLGVTPEQRQNAAGQYARATEVIGAGGDTDYAVQLLISCCKLDPVNILYRKMLRETVRDSAEGKRGSWFGALSRLPARNRLKATLRAGAYRKVIDDGEELLARFPSDVPTQLEMAEAASALELPDLATWMLEQARVGAPESVDVLRALATHYGECKRYSQSAAVWEQVKKLVPGDSEAQEQIREMSVNETLARTSRRRG